MFGIDDAALAIGASSLISGFMGADAADKAASAGRDAANTAASVQRETYQTTRSDLAPYRNAGVPAMQRLMYLSGVGGGSTAPTRDWQSFYDESLKRAPQLPGASPVNLGSFIDGGSMSGPLAAIWGAVHAAPDSSAVAGSSGGPDTGWARTEADRLFGDYQTQQTGDAKNAASDPAYGSLVKPFDYSLTDFYKDPSYQFRLDEGNKALERAASSRGLAQSTPGLKQLMQWNQDYASTEYGNAFSRAFGVDQSNKNTTYNFLSGIAGMGQNAAAMTGTIGANAASGTSSAILAGGQATSAGILGGASAVNNSIQGGLGNYMYQQRFDQMMKRMPVFGTPTTTGGSVPAGMVYGRDF